MILRTGAMLALYMSALLWENKSTCCLYYTSSFLVLFFYWCFGTLFWQEYNSRVYTDTSLGEQVKWVFLFTLVVFRPLFLGIISRSKNGTPGKALFGPNASLREQVKGLFSLHLAILEGIFSTKTG